MLRGWHFSFENGHTLIEDRKVNCSLSNNVIAAPWVERLTNWLKEFVWRKRARI